MALILLSISEVFCLDKYKYQLRDIKFVQYVASCKDTKLRMCFK